VAPGSAKLGGPHHRHDFSRQIIEGSDTREKRLARDAATVDWPRRIDDPDAAGVAGDWSGVG
jgi:hypothetical protein